MRHRLRLYMLRLIGLLARQLSHTRPNQPQRVLVIRPDHLGDILLLTPALRLLRQQLPAAHITLLIGPWAEPVVGSNPDVDIVLTCPFPGFTRTSKTSLLQPYLLLLRMALLLRIQRFDAAVVARDDHWWGALLAALAGIPQRIGYATPETVPFLTQSLPHTFAAHVTTQSIELVTALSQQQPDHLPQMRTPAGASDQAWAAAWLASRLVEPSAALVAIHPGAGGAAKLWLNHRWIEVANALHQRGALVVLTGGAGEREMIEEIADGVARRPLILVGEATIPQLAALYAHCTLVLGVDSGPLHLAVAAGVPTIALFGPGDVQRFGPWGNPQRNIVLRSGLWCSPCGVLASCPRGTAPSECMTLIPTGHVLAALDDVLLAKNYVDHSPQQVALT